MIIRVVNNEARLEEVEDLTSLRAELTADDPLGPSPLAKFGHVDDNHLWISIAELRQHAHEVGTGEGWDAEIDRMIDYAVRKGWTSEDARSVRVHIEAVG